MTQRGDLIIFERKLSSYSLKDGNYSTTTYELGEATSVSRSGIATAYRDRVGGPIHKRMPTGLVNSFYVDKRKTNVHHMLEWQAKRNHKPIHDINEIKKELRNARP